MMDLDTIRALNNDIAISAERRGLVPLVVEQTDIDRAKQGDYRAINMPNMGPYLPNGWQRVSLTELGDDDIHGTYMDDNAGFGAYFVDKTGWGETGEPALTIGQFIRKLQPGYGYAMIEEGQFQVKVGVFKYVN